MVDSKNRRLRTPKRASRRAKTPVPRPGQPDKLGERWLGTQPIGEIPAPIGEIPALGPRVSEAKSIAEK
jgi:hypothetical protein